MAFDHIAFVEGQRSSSPPSNILLDAQTSQCLPKLGVYSTARLIRDFTTRKGLQSKWAMVFMILSSVFILLFSTLASAMTGYTANVVSQVRDYRGNAIPFENFNYLLFTIHDGDRIGLGRDFYETMSTSGNLASDFHRKITNAFKVNRLSQ